MKIKSYTNNLRELGLIDEQVMRSRFNLIGELQILMKVIVLFIISALMVREINKGNSVHNCDAGANSVFEPCL